MAGVDGTTRLTIRDRRGPAGCRDVRSQQLSGPRSGADVLFRCEVGGGPILGDTTRHGWRVSIVPGAPVVASMLAAGGLSYITGAALYRLLTAQPEAMP